MLLQVNRHGLEIPQYLHPHNRRYPKFFLLQMPTSQNRHDHASSRHHCPDGILMPRDPLTLPMRNDPIKLNFVD